MSLQQENALLSNYFVRYSFAPVSCPVSHSVSCMRLMLRLAHETEKQPISPIPSDLLAIISINILDIRFRLSFAYTLANNLARVTPPFRGATPTWD